jgi:chromosome segregation ATPase
MTHSERLDDGQPSFDMEQFRVAGPGRIEVQGTWEGVQDVDLDRSVLVLHLDDRVDQVDAESVRRTSRTWHASFAWDGDPSDIRNANLEVGDRLTVDLGPHPSRRRRLGRTTRPVLALVADPAEASRQVGVEDGIIAVHTALVTAREELAQAVDEIDAARQQARRASEDAERERERRRHEAERHQEALNTLKSVAAEAVDAERGRIREQAAEIERIKGALATAAAEAADAQQHADAAARERRQVAERARSQIESAQSELTQARQEIEELRARQSELGVMLSDARTEAAAFSQAEAKHRETRILLVETREAAEGFHNEALIAQRNVAELEQVAATAKAEIARLQAELEQTQKLARRTTRELERAGEEAREAQGLRELVARLEAALADARRDAADAQMLRDRVKAIRSALLED